MKQLLGVLLLVGVILTWWKWLLLLAVVVLVVKAFPVALREFREEQAARKERAAEIAARADEQTAWVDAGDPRGIFGLYMPDNRMYPPYIAS